ncbi:right-handed parallel beta-helix repeat-containing protein [Halorussus marinus]|uniref:right-handed parallel beta-helix repeat-containing protein n=1 Tax=Halorussus marinus TaxID=2505976 RepID=UPI00106E5036|nr:NosD domain-containing protein [Halorussus marinus]
MNRRQFLLGAAGSLGFAVSVSDLDMTEHRFPEDAGTGAHSSGSGDKNDAANFAQAYDAIGKTDYAKGLTFDVDYTVPEVTIDMEKAVVSDDSATATQSGESRTGVAYVQEMDAVTRSLTDGATNYIYLNLDLATDNDASYHIDTDKTPPSAPYLFLGSVDTSADVYQLANELPSEEFESISTDQLSITGQWHDIRDYGAVGDGTTDNSQAILDAINAADSDGGNVIIPPGDFYYQDQLVFTAISDVLVTGFGNQSILRHDDVGGTGGFRFEGATRRVTLQRFRHLGDPSTTEKQQGISIVGDTNGNVPKNCLVRNCVLEDWGGDAIVWFGDGGVSAEDISAIGNKIVNCGDDGINPGAGDGVVGGEVRDNIILDPNDRTNDGIHVSISANQVEVVENRIVGTNIGIGLFESHQNTIRGNRIENTQSHGIDTKSGDATNNFQNKILGNTIISPSGTGIRVGNGEDHEIKNNTIEGANRGIQANVRGLNIVGNEIITPSDYGIVLSISGNNSHSKTSDNYVSGTVNNNGIFIDASRVALVGNTLTDADINESGGDYNTIQDNIAPGGVSVSGTNSQSGGNITS